MSPEQARGRRDIDSRSDIYSLGATLYHMVTGRPPFDGETSLVIVSKHVYEQPQWPAGVNPSVSEGMCRIIMKMMTKTPEDRYQTADEVCSVLDRLESGPAYSPERRPDADGPEVRPSAKRSRSGKSRPEHGGHRRGCAVQSWPWDTIAASSQVGGPRRDDTGPCPFCGARGALLPAPGFTFVPSRSVINAAGKGTHDDLVAAFERAIRTAIRDGPANVVLDISGVRNVTAEFVSFIIPWNEKLRAVGCNFKVLCGGKARIGTAGDRNERARRRPRAIVGREAQGLAGRGSSGQGLNALAARGFRRSNRNRSRPATAFTAKNAKDAKDGETLLERQRQRPRTLCCSPGCAVLGVLGGRGL
jgi:hypothetical protein